ncbi:MAG: GDYXXLXY domain-containing protein [Algicola sp.]|nr:GDYXXLXY domain-containing protein [Algicola sp.]
MKKYSSAIIVLNLIVFLGLFNYSIVEKENVLANGDLVLFELAPVDPRSLMQGDYMSLRYALTSDINNDSIPNKGLCVVEVGSDGIAKKLRIKENNYSLKENEYLITYRRTDFWNISLGVESYFFQEGTAEKYENAKYGGFVLDKKGNSILIGLYNETLKKIE